MVKAVFLDKDGTLVDDIPFNVDPDRVRLTTGAGNALRRLREHGFRLFVVSNQPGVALGRFDARALARVEAAIGRRLAAKGAYIDGYFYCFHAPCPDTNGPRCGCRKPAPGLIQRAAARHGIDLAASWMVGDILDDVEAGGRAGCATALVDVGNETLWRDGPWRRPDFQVTDLEQAADRILAGG